MDARDVAAWSLAAATLLMLAVYGREPWIAAVGAAVAALLLAGSLVFRLLARELGPRDAPRRLLRHRGLLAAGLAAAGTSCLLAAALVTRHAEAGWGLLYWLLALLMTAGIVAIRFAYHGDARRRAQ